MLDNLLLDDSDGQPATLDTISGIGIQADRLGGEEGIGLVVQVAACS